MRDIQKNIATLTVIKSCKLDLVLVHDPETQTITLGKPAQQDNDCSLILVRDSSLSGDLITEAEESKYEYEQIKRIDHFSGKLGQI